MSEAQTNIEKSPVYKALGVALLEYVVPTAATAGMLTVIVKTFDGMHVGTQFDIRLFLGWFAAILFVVSTGHSARHNNQSSWGPVAFDLIETLAMVAAFHFLGLVTDNTLESVRWFYAALFVYLATILARRWRKQWRSPTHENSDADLFIIGLTVLVAAGSLLFMIFYSPLASANLTAGIVLFLALGLYIKLAIAREKKTAPATLQPQPPLAAPPVTEPAKAPEKPKPAPETAA